MERAPEFSREQAEVVGFDRGCDDLLVLAQPKRGKTHTPASRPRHGHYPRQEFDRFAVSDIERCTTRMTVPPAT
jgi:hypothetical protein